MYKVCCFQSIRFPVHKCIYILFPVHTNVHYLLCCTEIHTEMYTILFIVMYITDQAISITKMYTLHFCHFPFIQSSTCKSTLLTTDVQCILYTWYTIMLFHTKYVQIMLFFAWWGVQITYWCHPVYSSDMHVKIKQSFFFISIYKSCLHTLRYFSCLSHS